jgi:hypothetical protein
MATCLCEIFRYRTSSILFFAMRMHGIFVGGWLSEFFEVGGWRLRLSRGFLKNECLLRKKVFNQNIRKNSTF